MNDGSGIAKAGSASLAASLATSRGGSGVGILGDFLISGDLVVGDDIDPASLANLITQRECERSSQSTKDAIRKSQLISKENDHE